MVRIPIEGKMRSCWIFLALWLAVGFLTVRSAVLWAGETPSGDWGGTVESSLLTARGNSSTQTGSLKSEAAKETKQDKWIGRAGGLLAKSEGETTAEYYYLNGEYNNRLNTRTYSNYFLGWEKDTLAGLDTRLTARFGLGHEYFRKDPDLLVAEAGVAFVYENEKEHTQSFPEGRLFGKYVHTLREGVVFSQELEGLQDLTMLANYRVNSLSAFEVAINSHWAVKTSLTVHYDHEPAEGFLKTDTFTETSVVYRF